MPDSLTYPAWLKAGVLVWMPLIAFLFFFTTPRREVLICEQPDQKACRLEVTQGLRTRVVPVRSVRVENDADTKRPSLVVETTVNVEHFSLGDAMTPDKPIELLGRRWWTIMGVLAAIEAALVLFFAVKRRPAPT